MKKVLTIIASCFLLVFCFTFVSCGTSKLQGTYKLYQVVTVKNGKMTATDGANYKIDGNKEYVYKFNKDGTGSLTKSETQEDATIISKTINLTWSADGANVTFKEVKEGETSTEVKAYFNDGLLTYTLSQTEEETVLLVFKKNTFSLSGLFKKSDKKEPTSEQQPTQNAEPSVEPSAE